MKKHRNINIRNILLLLFAGAFSATVVSCATRPAAPDVSFSAPRLSQYYGSPVAVLPFKNETEFLGADYLVTDEFNLRLGMTKLFRPIERIRVEELYREQDLDPGRMSDTDAIESGRLLGARAVVLGSVTRYKSSNRPPEIPIDAFPVQIPVNSFDDAIAWALVNSAAALVNIMGLKPAVAEVGITARLVDTETGEIIWQGRNEYRGDDEKLLERRDRSEWGRIRKDVMFLTSILATDLMKTLHGHNELNTPSGTENADIDRDE